MRLNNKNLRVAARHSDLARLQAYRVGAALASCGGPVGGSFGESITVEYAFRASLGDLNQTDPLWKMPEKGVFTEDFLRDLKKKTADLVVHSWKDLPTESRGETEIVATLPRADVRDLLLFRRDRLEVAKKTGRVRVLTSSPRRAHNLKDFLRTHLPKGESEFDVSFESVRGNIPTRLKKLLSQDVEALVVAKAALDRLLTTTEEEFAEVRAVIRTVLAESLWMVLPLSVNPTAAAQGALAVEILRERKGIREIVQSVNCIETFQCVEKERAILASYGGGCHQKIGVSVLRRPYGDITFLRGLTDRGEILNKIELIPSRAVAPSAKSDEQVFPRAGEESAFFTREEISRAAWAWAEKESFLWVARETAWPQAFKAEPKATVWTAGLRTWEKLAQRGVWVNGSSEGLGEDEPTRIESLLARESIAWIKLTHADSENANPNVKPCATYRLVPRSETPTLKDRTHFFWMSGSSFDRALELNPSIRNAYHASGPGLTHKHLRQLLGPDAKIDIYLGIDDWRAKVICGKR
jgi:hydroxymethylbilane synthase